jgi:PAS domain S-box-containing protein
MDITREMSWTRWVDAILWVVSLAVSIFLARVVYRRRDLPARLFTGMVVSLAILQARQLAATLSELLVWLFPALVSDSAVDLIHSIRPLDVAALVVFACLNLHLFLVFPTESRVIRRWRWSPLAFYVPGAFLALMMLTRLALEAGSYRALWGLDRLGIGDDTLQLLFVILTFVVALLRLSLVYTSRASAVVRRQLAWILWGLVVGGGLALLTDYIPRIANLPSLASYVPGLDQLPTLIILGAFALSIVRYHTFDVVVVLNRSVVYAVLIVVTTLLYLALATALGVLLQTWSPDTRLPIIAILTTLIVVLAALPLRDAIQRWVDRYFLRGQANYRRLLQEYSRSLTNVVALPRLLLRMAEQVEDVLHPSGVAIVLGDDGEGCRVALSRGDLASQELWQEGACFDEGDLVPSSLSSRHSPFYLPWQAHDVPEPHRQEWQRLEGSGAHVFIPMHLRGSLLGWLVLGPKRSELAYTRAELDFLSALTDQSSVSLENARLYGQMQQRATELAMMSIVSSAISSSLDLEHVLQTITESIIQVVGCDKSAIFELSEDGRELDLRMARGLSLSYMQNARHLPVRGDSRTTVITTGQPLIVPDVRAEPWLAELADLAEEEGYRAVIDLPLIGGEGPLGVLSAFFASVHEPSASELEVLTTFANHAAIAIENARLHTAVTRQRDRARRLYEQTDAALARRVEQLTTLEEVSRQLTSTLDLEQVMDLVLERVLQTIRADRGAIVLRELQGGGLRLAAQKGFSGGLERYLAELWPDQQGITGRVARTGRPALVPDVSQDPDYFQAVPTTLSQLSVPIIHEGAILGVISLEGDRRAAFTEEHVRFVELLADHAAIGINNARLFQQVIEGHDRLQAILDSTYDAVIVLDTDGRVILANPRVQELFGSAVAEWLNSANLLEVDQLLESQVLERTDLDPGELMEMVGRVRDHPEEVVNVAFRYRLGERRWFIEGIASPVFGVDGEVIGWVAVLSDVTRQQELERFREDLTSMVIHNLQGPLAAMISSLETLREDGLGDSDTSRELLRIALGSGHDLYKRIESLLWIRRLEDKDFPLHRRALSLAEVFGPVVDEYLPLARKAGLVLDKALAPDLPQIVVDGDMVGRVLSNLVDNALKYTPAGGRVQVRASPGQGADRAFVVCCVADTGPGIPADAREVIFDKFRRGEQPAHRQRRGMGIGLHFCKVTVEAHGGRIWVESQEGQGSTFCFTLPTVAGESA